RGRRRRERALEGRAGRRRSKGERRRVAERDRRWVLGDRYCADLVLLRCNQPGIARGVLCEILEGLAVGDVDRHWRRAIRGGRGRRGQAVGRVVNDGRFGGGKHDRLGRGELAARRVGGD